jgi:polar amino acid transport system ATP-binding protein
MFDAGRIVEEGDPVTMFSAPKHDRTKTFLKAVLAD